MRKNKLVLGLLALCLCASSTGNKNQANALDEDSYQAILPYESSDTRSKHVGLIQNTDLRVEMESGLMDLSKKYFSPTTVGYKTHQFLDYDELDATDGSRGLLGTVRDGNPNGLNPSADEEFDTGNGIVTNATILVDIYELDWYTNDTLIGISLGLVVKGNLNVSDGSSVDITDEKMQNYLEVTFSKLASYMHERFNEINKNIPVDYSIIGDLKAVLEILNRKLEQHYHKAWVDKVMARKEALPLSYHTDALTGPYVIERISELTDNEAIITTDVGQHQMWAAQYLHHTKSRGFLTSGGLGTMGFGYGAAIGAKLAVGESRPVIHITGDGSFHMNLNEACTAVSDELPVITVIFNNTVLGMVRQWQTAFYGKRYSSTDPHRKTNYVKLAEGFGAKGYHCETLDAFSAAFAEALKSKGPVWIECVIDKDEKVLPMIPAGGSIEDMIMD